MKWTLTSWGRVGLYHGGMLLGHIVQGIKTIERIGRQVDADRK